MRSRAADSARASPREVVLVGGGHAHVQVLRSLVMRPLADVRLTVVVDRHEAVYSGMVPGLVAGDYTRDELVIDVQPLARRAGARCIEAAATGVDPVARTIALAGRPSLHYDVASLDVGSSVRDHELPGVREHATATRPIGSFVQQVERRIADGAAERRVVVVGGGAAGCELALCLEARLRRAGQPAQITVVAESRELLPGGSAQLASIVAEEARRRGVALVLGVRVLAVEAAAIVLEHPGGRSARLDSDWTIFATGAAAPDWLAKSPLPTTREGFVRVDRRSEVVGCPGLFAVGDCAVPDHAPWVPRAGVYAVRAGPVLTRNLRARLGHGSPTSFRPQRDFLALLNLGDGRAAGGKWGFAASGRAVFALKDRIDGRFVERFRVLDGEGAPSASFPPPPALDPHDTMRCGGCAAKVGPSPLRAALASLPPAPPDESVRVGLADGDDTALVELPHGERLHATIDGFRAFLDDPWLVGRVAAVNALSDVFAKGGRPLHALALVTVPDGAPDAQQALLGEVLAGIRAALDALGVSLVGGHSTTGAELFVALSIVGVPAEGRPVLGLDGARPGDCLLLSKPLGTGVLLAADRRGLARGEWISALARSLVRDNGAAAQAALAHGATAATDVSGFGLAGHLLALLERSGAGAELDAKALPALPGAAALLLRGLRSTSHEQNAALRARVRGGPGVRDDELDLLFDPQTSGGLLLAVPAPRAEALLAALHAGGDHAASRIGCVVATPDGGPSIALVRGRSRDR